MWIKREHVLPVLHTGFILYRLAATVATSSDLYTSVVSRLAPLLPGPVQQTSPPDPPNDLVYPDQSLQTGTLNTFLHRPSHFADWLMKITCSTETPQLSLL